MKDYRGMNEQTRKKADDRHMPSFAEPQPVGYDAAGVDVTLVRWFLALTPAQRLDILQDHVNAILDIRKSNASH